MRSSTLFGAFLVAASVLGCDSARPPVSTPPPVVTVSPPPSATPTAEPSTTPTVAPTATQAPTAAPAKLTPDELRWVGSWSSRSCGERTYERRLTLKEDKTFTAEDRVSPCPPKVQCIWAGIVYWSGTWATNDKGVLLTKTSGGKDPTKKANTDEPVQLVWDKGASAPAEVGSGGAACVYARSGEAPAK